MVFTSPTNFVATRMYYYVIQAGSGSGKLQMGIYVPTATTTASLVAATPIITVPAGGGLNGMTLTTTPTINANSTYYLVIYTTFNAQSIAGFGSVGLGSIFSAPPTNFRVQNIPPTGLPASISTSDSSTKMAPWLAVG